MIREETVYIISKYYPGSAAYEFHGIKLMVVGIHAVDTYKKLKYNNLEKNLNIVF